MALYASEAERQALENTARIYWQSMKMSLQNSEVHFRFGFFCTQSKLEVWLEAPTCGLVYFLPAYNSALLKKAISPAAASRQRPIFVYTTSLDVSLDVDLIVLSSSDKFVGDPVSISCPLASSAAWTSAAYLFLPGSQLHLVFGNWKHLLFLVINNSHNLRHQDQAHHIRNGVRVSPWKYWRFHCGPDQ